MWNDIEEQKKNIEQFYRCQQTTTTDLYRVKYYAETIEKNLERLKGLIERNDQISPENGPEYVKNLNDISVQVMVIKSAQQAMSDQMLHLKRAEDIQTRLCGNIIHLKKDIEQILKKAEKLIS